MRRSERISRRAFIKSATTISTAAGVGVDVETDTGTAERRDFVLVHGGWHGGWCYARVAQILRGQGHRVFTPTLTGLGERSHLTSGFTIDCSTHIKDIINVIEWEQLQNVVLCGHSYGGLVIGGVADAIPERIATLLYLDAFIPQNGRSLLDLTVDASDPKQIFEFFRNLTDHGIQMLPPVPANYFNVNSADRATVDALCTPHPFASCVERLKLTGEYMKIANKAFVLATAWSGIPALRKMYEQIKHDKGWTVIEVPCGHDVMLDAPKELAEILIRVMSGTAQR